MSYLFRVKIKVRVSNWMISLFENFATGFLLRVRVRVRMIPDF